MKKLFPIHTPSILSLACVQMGAGSFELDLFCSPPSPTNPEYFYLLSYAAAVASSSSIKTHDASFLHHQNP
jgi:hypothetical protein